MSEPPRNGLHGNLRLVCAAHPERGTFLAEQSFAAPVHLSKSYWDGHTLLIHVVNPTAGFFGGDSVSTRVVVEPGARVLLSSPSAARFHPSHGREARLDQTFEIHAGGSLDVFPEISIPQRDSRSFQKTVIDLAAGAELIYLETLAPGRVASGEAFLFARYAWSTDIRLAGRRVHRERADLAPGYARLAGLRAFFPASYYAGVVCISPAVENDEPRLRHEIARLGNDFSLRIAASRLTAGGWSIRLLAADSLSLRDGIRRLRAWIYAQLGRPVPDTRRNG